MIPRKILNAWPGFLIILFSAILLVWISWPSERQIETLTLTGSQLEDLSQEGIFGRQVRLEFPKTMRIGESAEVSLEILPGQPTALVPDKASRPGSVEALARLDLPGVLVQPAEISSTALLPGEPARFHWSLTPRWTGTFAGETWLYFQFYPEGGEQASQKTISAQPIQIGIQNSLGLPLYQLKILGWSGLAIGIFISLGILTFTQK